MSQRRDTKSAKKRKNISKQNQNTACWRKCALCANLIQADALEEPESGNASGFFYSDEGQRAKNVAILEEVTNGDILQYNLEARMKASYLLLPCNALAQMGTGDAGSP
jgi:uncharacterized protein YaiL (DUF2058 family)